MNGNPGPTAGERFAAAGVKPPSLSPRGLVAQEWYYAVDGDRQGPISAAELKNLAEAGKLKAGDLVWKEGMPDWAPAKSIKGLFTAAATPAAAPAPARTDEPARPRSKSVDDDRPSARERRRDPEDEDDRPRRRRDQDDDRDEDDRPSGRVRRRDDDRDDPDEDRPRRRRDRDEDEDDRPRKRKRGRAPEDVSSKKLAVSLVAILTAVLGLGWIGIHKFMLGKTKSGLIMLLGSVLTCFIGAIVFNLFSLIEGIIYLTKSDEEFYETYVVGDKEWF